MLEMLLGNHPLDCPVCDAGGECELQDMTFSYGAAESKFMDAKNHKDEQQWSPVVFFRPAAMHSLLPLRAGLRRGHGCLGSGCAEPRRQLDHRPIKKIIWNAKSAACASTSARGCADFRRVSLQDASLGDEARGHCLHPLCATAARPRWACAAPIPAWKSCAATIATRAASTAISSALRDVTPSILQTIPIGFAAADSQGWQVDSSHVGTGLRPDRDQVSGSPGYRRSVIDWRDWFEPHQQRRKLLATEVCAPGARNQQYRSSPHCRLSGFRLRPGRQIKCNSVSMRDVFSAPAILLIGNDPTEQHPLLAWQIRSNVRLHRAKFYVANSSAHQAAPAGYSVCADSASGSEGSLVQFPRRKRRRSRRELSAEAAHSRSSDQIARRL
jgi:hypothetical protein